MAETMQDIEQTFSLLDSWEERYSYIIELGRQLAPFPPACKTSAHKVSGCVSQVWLITQKDNQDDPILHFMGDSDAHIVKGLVYIVVLFFSGKRASEVIEGDIEGFLRQLNLHENLTPQRSNGLKSMVSRIKQDAAQILAQNRDKN